MLCVEQAVVLTDDRQEFLDRAQWHLEIYTGLPNYRRSWEAQGFEDSDFVPRWQRAAEGSDGRLGRRRRRSPPALRQHLRSGADHVVIQALGSNMFEIPADQWRELAPALVGL